MPRGFHPRWDMTAIMVRKTYHKSNLMTFAQIDRSRYPETFRVEGEPGHAPAPPNHRHFVSMTPRPKSKGPKEPPLFRELRRDHERVLEEIGALEAALARPARRTKDPSAAEASLPALVALLGRQFDSHMAAEDEVLYPALLGAIPAASGSIEPLFAEHAELRQMLARLATTLREPATAERSEQIGVQVHDLADLLRLHIRKEESLVFRLAPQLLAPGEIAAVSARLSRRQETDPATRPVARRPKGDDS